MSALIAGTYLNRIGLVETGLDDAPSSWPLFLQSTYTLVNNLLPKLEPLDLAVEIWQEGWP